MTHSRFGALGRNPQARSGAHVPWLVVALLAVILVGASGCNTSDCSGTPQDGTVRVSQQAAQRLQARVDQIPAGSVFTLEATDEEVTSYLATYLQQSPLTNAQVRFVSGKFQVYATAAQLLNVSVATVWTALVDAGQVRIKLESASVNCLPVPPALLDSVSATLNQMILESEVNVQVKDIRIDPGKVTVTASMNP